MERTSGILMHISSLWGEYSCGSFGDEAKEFIDFIKECGFTWWQVLPFGMTDESNSPYKSYSAFGGNLNFVDLKKLKNKNLITEDELIDARQRSQHKCEYKRLSDERFLLLSKAAQRAVGTPEENKVRDFIVAFPEIEEFTEFMVLKSINGNKSWNEWTANSIDTGLLFVWQFIQYEFFTQWKEIKDYANEKGIKIMGDIPIYVSYDSADVWANKDLFQINDDNTMKAKAGVPPDYFSQEGQLWGNPLYNWENMKKDGYAWWLRRINFMFKLFDGIRIDHFRAIESYWSVDAASSSAKNGQWVQGPGMDFINAIKSIQGERLIVAEDLGLISDGVKKLVADSGFSTMRVMQFGFSDNSDSLHLPHNYIPNAVAYTGTHDNNTLLGYLQEIGCENRNRFFDYCMYNGTNIEEALEYIIRTLYASVAETVIIPVQDILHSRADTRMNVPGKKDGNWLYRVTKEQLLAVDVKKYRALAGLYKRLSPYF